MKPMLAATAEDPSKLKFPLLATPKLDGIRCLNVGGRALSRSFKPIRNNRVQELIAELPHGTDGELIAGNFQSTTSTVMSADGGSDFEYWVFDVVGDGPYKDRVKRIPEHTKVHRLLPELIGSYDALLRYEETCIEEGFEGIIVRDPDGPYKFGRSTLREGWMVKVKRFVDSEAIVLGVEEQMQNMNPVVPDAFGYSRRPGGKTLSVPKGTLGSLVVRDTTTGVEFSIGSGFDDALRAALWLSPPLGRIVKYKYQPTGVKTAPRFPVFLGFRED